MTEHDILLQLAELLAAYRDRQTLGDCVDYLAPQALQAELALDAVGTEGDWQQVFIYIRRYLDHTIKSSHPAFVNRMWSGANLPSILGEMAVAVANTSACTYESAPVSTLMERYMIDEMLALVGFHQGDGQMTTGSSNANMIAMLTARNLANERVQDTGLFAQSEMFACVSAEAHYSMDKAANILGIGRDHLRKIATNSRGEMVPEALAVEIEAIQAGGGKVFFVAATAGTTVRGAYDPIQPLLDLRDRHGFWLHVDGAWGGAVIMSTKLRQRYLAGIERVDSFTWDFHKMLGSALMCNVLLMNNRPGVLACALAGGDGSYLFRDTDDGEVQDLGHSSLQCGRRVDSLKWFLDWKYFGRDGFARRIENYLQLCEYAEQRVLATAELELVAPRTSFNICFCYRCPPAVADAFNQTLRTRLYQQGRAMIGLAYVHGRLVMRLLITNPLIDRQEVDSFFASLLQLGQELAAEPKFLR